MQDWHTAAATTIFCACKRVRCIGGLTPKLCNKCNCNPPTQATSWVYNKQLENLCVQYPTLNRAQKRKMKLTRTHTCTQTHACMHTRTRIHTHTPIHTGCCTAGTTCTCMWQEHHGSHETPTGGRKSHQEFQWVVAVKTKWDRRLGLLRLVRSLGKEGLGKIEEGEMEVREDGGHTH